MVRGAVASPTGRLHRGRVRVAVHRRAARGTTSPSSIRSRPSRAPRQDITWTVVLPSDGSPSRCRPGADVLVRRHGERPEQPVRRRRSSRCSSIPTRSSRNCTPNGGFVVSNVPNDYTVCSPVWSSHDRPEAVFHEPAAFNAMLTDRLASTAARDARRRHDPPPLLRHRAKDGWHIDVTDRTTGQSGTIVLDRQRRRPADAGYDTQEIGNSLSWGIVYDTPNSFVWEIGHTSPFTSPASAVLLAGRAGLPVVRRVRPGPEPSADPDPQSSPSRRLAPSSWAVVSDYGGKAEVLDPSVTGPTCTTYGGPFCIYPWYTQASTGRSLWRRLPDTAQRLR